MCRYNPMSVSDAKIMSSVLLVLETSSPERDGTRTQKVESIECRPVKVDLGTEHAVGRDPEGEVPGHVEAGIRMVPR
jgi:hypothetical protein